MADKDQILADMADIVNDITGVDQSEVTFEKSFVCLLYTSPSPRDVEESRMPSSA